MRSLDSKPSFAELAYTVAMRLTRHVQPGASATSLVQVLGNVKGVVAVIVSVLWFRNPISLYGMLGYGVTVGGVVAYSQVGGCPAPKSCPSCNRRMPHMHGIMAALTL